MFGYLFFNKKTQYLQMPFSDKSINFTMYATEQLFYE